MKYIVKIRYLEFSFNLGTEALNFAERAKASIVRDAKYDNDVVIEVVDDGTED